MVRFRFTSFKSRLIALIGDNTTHNSGLEGLHKILRNVRKDLSRKNSLYLQIQDVFKFMWTQSDPQVRAMRRRLECSQCLATSHTKRGCPELKNNVIHDEDNDLVNSLLLD